MSNKKILLLSLLLLLVSWVPRLMVIIPIGLLIYFTIKLIKTKEKKGFLIGLNIIYFLCIIGSFLWISNDANDKEINNIEKKSDTKKKEKKAEISCSNEEITNLAKLEKIECKKAEEKIKKEKEELKKKEKEKKEKEKEEEKIKEEAIAKEKEEEKLKQEEITKEKEQKRKEEAKRTEAEKKAKEEADKKAEQKRIEEERKVNEIIQQEELTRSESYKNCTELRKIYPDGIGSNHPAYESKHDRDGDGWACE